MKIIYNRFIPFDPFWATNLCGFVFVRKDKGRLTEVASNHEYIHSLQQREMGYIFFFIWYNIEWFLRLLIYRDSMQAYRNIVFEREAYDRERQLNYASSRRPFAWWKYYGKAHRPPTAHRHTTSGSLRREIGDFCTEIRDFIRDDFRPLKYAYFLLAAAALLVAQVHFHFYDWAMKPSYEAGTSMTTITIIYLAVYFTSLIVTLALHDASGTTKRGDTTGTELRRLRHWQVWVFPIVLISIQGAGQGFNSYKTWIHEAALSTPEVNFLTITGSFFFRSVAIVGLLCLFRWATAGRFGLYGLTRSARYLKVYGLIYAALIPIFVAVSFTPQFLAFYPKMSINYCEGAFQMADAWLISIFELCYANDFLGVESMFRGALVIGMARWLGPRAVIPMALTYMSIHLGKPDLEMCSSVIGGYLLGILAYRTKHLWGGITIHLGIAMLFEFLGLLRIYLT